MIVQPIIPDVAPQTSATMTHDTSAFGAALDGVGKLLQQANESEERFAAGSGPLHAAVYDRARADVALSIASAASSRAAQALQAILNMAV